MSIAILMFFVLIRATVTASSNMYSEVYITPSLPVRAFFISFFAFSWLTSSAFLRATNMFVSMKTDM